MDQKSGELKHMQLALEDKRAELLKVQTRLQELEDRYYSSTASIQDKAVEEFRVGYTKWFLWSQPAWPLSSGRAKGILVARRYWTTWTTCTCWSTAFKVVEMSL